MATTCPFFTLPVELRLHIYSFAILDNPSITISSARLTGSHPDIIHRLYGCGREPYAGLPEYHEPIVEAGYNASLLSVADPALIPLTPGSSLPSESHEHRHTAHDALLLVNKQVNEELASHFKLERNRRTSLFLSFPHGLHVCKNLTPHLLRQARTVHIAGSYVSKTFCPRRAACMGPRQGVPELETKFNGGEAPDSAKQLSELVQSCFGPEAKHPVQKMELRMYYPGDDAYSTVWGDDSSPVVIALRNIYCGDVGIEVWRGRSGTGVYLTARHSATGEKRRVVSTVWRKLEEGRRGEPKCGSWAVDPRWPDFEDGYTMSDGPKGDVIING